MTAFFVFAAAVVVLEAVLVFVAAVSSVWVGGWLSVLQFWIVFLFRVLGSWASVSVLVSPKCWSEGGATAAAWWLLFVWVAGGVFCVTGLFVVESGFMSSRHGVASDSGGCRSYFHRRFCIRCGCGVRAVFVVCGCC